MSAIENLDLKINSDNSDYVQKFREARNSPAVHKITLATIRAHCPECLVFVCEGVDDKKIYFHWLRSINSNLNYEFQICNGKKYLLEFRKLLSQDKSGLNRQVYFFVDRDFDGLRDHSPGPDIYVSDFYSFENWLVSKEILDSVLCLDLHCHGDRLIRKDVIRIFEKVYADFLSITKPHNERLFLARHLGINTRPIPRSVGKLAEVSLTAVYAHYEDAVAVINLEREPTPSEMKEGRTIFDEINPQQGYRGKFAMMFFIRWIELLGNDKNAENSVIFKNMKKSIAKANCQLSLDSLAAKSLPPPLFRNFIETILAHTSPALRL